MIQLVNRFKARQLTIHEFLGHSKVLLGDRLYALLVRTDARGRPVLTAGW